MTIQDFALKQGVSKGTIYNVVKRSNFSLNQITNGSGRITPEGLTILKSLFTVEDEPEADNLRREEELQQLRDALRETEQERDALRADRDALRAEKDALKVQLDAEKEKSALYERLFTEERENHQKAVEAADEARKRADGLLLREQENHKLFLMNPIKRLFAGRQRGTVTAESSRVE